MPRRAKHIAAAEAAAPGGDEGTPERRCIVTGARSGSAGLIRFVLDPEDRVVADLGGSLPGRGYWVTADRAALRQAVERRAFQRAARRPVTVDAGLLQVVEGGLLRRCRELLALARRAGQAVAGFEKVSAMLAAGRAVVLVEASDGAEDGRRKLHRHAAEVPVVSCLTAGELGLAFGRAVVVHAALGRGGLSVRFLEETRRLRGVRDTPDFAPGVRASGKGYQ